jgi:hypothetical protein
MIKGLLTTVRKVLGLFVDDGSLAISILVWIFALHLLAPIVSIEQTWAAPVLFLGCAGILIENVLRASRQPVLAAQAVERLDATKR